MKKPVEDGHFILPTAETVLVNMYSGEIIDKNSLPMKFAGYTPCYRKEAGSYRSEERGMIRGHQFNKVELFQYTTKDGSDQAFEELVNKACALVEGLGLHARDYQARRGNMRYRTKDGKIEFVHTLNASGLATSRVFPALLEQFQNADGSVNIPEPLQKYMGGLKVIK